MLRVSLYGIGQTPCAANHAEARNVSRTVLISPNRARKTPLAQFPKICNCTVSDIRLETLAPLPRLGPIGDPGQRGARALQAARKAVTVLVVEDDWLIREDIVTGLREEGWAVLEAATGAGALTALREAEKVDLLITDIRLADALTGWDVAEAFRTSHPEVPVIYASGNPANDHRRIAGSVFLSKPVAAWELTAACRKLLAQPISPSSG